MTSLFSQLASPDSRLAKGCPPSLNHISVINNRTMKEITFTPWDFLTLNGYFNG
jgi:hypothetical protein